MSVRLGFIGFGIMGERLMRAALAHEPGKVAVSGIFDPSPAAVQRLRGVSDTIAAFDSAAAVIAASDCLHIASPPASHLAYLELCAAAGRTALCEKPLATDVGAASAVVADLERKGMRAAVNFPFASSPAVEHLQRWLADGSIGTPQRLDIELAFATWPRPWQADAARWLDAPTEGGFLREVGSHFLFLSRRLLGPLELQHATCRYPHAGQSERKVDADLAAGGIPVRLTGRVGGTSKDDHNTWTLTGSRGRMRLRDWSIAERASGDDWQAPADALANEAARPLVLSRQLDKLCALSQGVAGNLATLREALDVQTTVEAILKTGQGG